MPTKASTKKAAGAEVRARERIAGRAQPKRHRAATAEDFKTAMLNIRVKDDLKREANATLAEIGISLPEAVRVFLGRVVSERAFPFELEVPNAETRQALQESRATRGKHYTSAEEMFRDLEKGSG